MPFTPVQTFLGGLLLHLSTSSLLTETGRVFGVSSLIDGAVYGDNASWRWAVLAGLISGPAVVAATGLAAALPDPGTGAWAVLPLGRLALAGALVGFGSKLGSGCTSGHMLCGVSRLSPRSLVATATFFLSAVLTARLFPAPLAELAANVATYPSKNHLAWLGGAVVLAVLARDAITALLPKLMKKCRAVPACPESAPPACEAENAVSAIPYYISGLTFAVGLSMSGMINPLKVLGFLRLPPPLDSFDPSLAMVVLGGIIPNAIHWAALRANQQLKPQLAWEKWQVPMRSEIDWRLLSGSALFGVGWGLAGVCPGPAVETLGQLATAAFNGADVSAAGKGWAVYFANLLVGMAAVRGLDKVLA